MADSGAESVCQADVDSGSTPRSPKSDVLVMARAYDVGRFSASASRTNATATQTSAVHAGQSESSSASPYPPRLGELADTPRQFR